MPKTLIATVAAAVVALSASTFAGDRDFEDVFVVKESSETPTVVLSGNVVPFKSDAGGAAARTRQVHRRYRG